jgi:hypothetical protein
MVQTERTHARANIHVPVRHIDVTCTYNVHDLSKHKLSTGMRDKELLKVRVKIFSVHIVTENESMHIGNGKRLA